jgi:phosphoglycolate phosphatase-like HAD superfamily hydrolase
MPSPASALVLFDIDGTLLRRAGPHHRLALEHAVGRAAGRPASTAGIAVQGMLDGDILARMMRAAGLTRAESKALLPEVMRLAQSWYVRRCPDLSRRVCPGVRSTLRALRRRGALLGLVTGNLSRIGWKKMERAGLREHFHFGAFAEQGATRTQLARLAVRQARRAGWISPSAPLALVGDHPNDIAAARGAGLKSVAVSTGLSAPAELSAHRPDLLVADLRDLNLDWLLT